MRTNPDSLLVGYGSGNITHRELRAQPSCRRPHRMSHPASPTFGQRGGKVRKEGPRAREVCDDTTLEVQDPSRAPEIRTGHL